MDMTKFLGPQDAGYQAVVGQLKRWMREKSKPNEDTTAGDSTERNVERSGERIVHGNVNAGGGQIFFGDNVHRGTGDMNFGTRPG
jgi:hypothetical protein